MARYNTDYSNPIENQVSWNLSQPLLNDIAEFLGKANKHYSTGHIDMAFFSLKIVKFRIIQNLTSDERELFKKIEGIFLKYGIKKDKEDNIKITSMGFKIFEDYNELLMDKLELYGYLIQKKEDKSTLTA